MGRKKALLLAASKEDTGDLSQSSVSPDSKSREVFKLRVHTCSRRGLNRGEFSIELEPRLTESKL